MKQQNNTVIWSLNGRSTRIRNGEAESPESPYLPIPRYIIYPLGFPALLFAQLCGVFYCLRFVVTDEVLPRMAFSND
jgi:hypothetical protein